MEIVNYAHHKCSFNIATLLVSFEQQSKHKYSILSGVNNAT